MINWIRKRFESDAPLGLSEWSSENSIFSHVASNLDTEGKLKDSAYDLPDEDRSNAEDNQIRFAPGLADAMFGADDSRGTQTRIVELSQLLSRIANQGDRRSQSDFYQLVTANESVIGIIDSFLAHVAGESLPVEPYLINFAKDMAFSTKHRNSVKFGIAILGLCQDKSVIKQLKIIGLHDEFTVFSVVAISNLSDNLVLDLWDLAKKVDGWGKIQTIDRLTAMDDLPEKLQDWLIREGYKNNIMYEYLAYPCAVNGGLRQRLESENIDESIFKSAGEILDALIAGGPAEDISDYADAAKAIENYIRHAKKHLSDIADFLTLTRIRDFLTADPNDLAEHKANGWTAEIISNSVRSISEILETRDWTALTLQALNSSDNTTYWDGKQAAKILNIDIWDIVWHKLIENPDDSSLWFDVANAADSEKADQVIDFALRTLPLNELATGPEDSHGLGPKYIRYQPLDYVIPFLENYPKKGEQIIRTALNSPVTRNRNLAIKVLENWKRENWSDSILNDLQKLIAVEPNNDTKANIRRLLKGDKLI
jgi:hypothetical protein